jgi:hypothetical protein
MTPPAPPTPVRRQGAKIEDRVAVSNADGTHWEGVTFWNPGDAVTPIFDILVLDSNRNVIASFKPPNDDRIDPKLPTTIEGGGVRFFKMRLMPAEVQSARWLQFRGERGLSEPVSWADRKLYVSLGGVSEVHATATATLTVQKLKARQEYLQSKGGVITKGITFINDTDTAVSVFDLRVLDVSFAEIVNFRRPHGRIRPELPLSVEAHHPLAITVELTPEQATHGEWLEWEETGGDKPRDKWTHRDVSVDLPPANVTLKASQDASYAEPPASSTSGPNPSGGERK